MLDELPMVFAASLALYTSLASKRVDASAFEQKRLKLLMTALPITVSIA